MPIPLDLTLLPHTAQHVPPRQHSALLVCSCPLITLLQKGSKSQSVPKLHMKAQSARTAAVMCSTKPLPGKSWANAREKKRFAQANTLKESGEIPLLLCKLSRNSAVPRVTEAHLAAASRHVLEDL